MIAMLKSFSLASPSLLLSVDAPNIQKHLLHGVAGFLARQDFNRAGDTARRQPFLRRRITDAFHVMALSMTAARFGRCQNRARAQTESAFSHCREQALGLRVCVIWVCLRRIVRIYFAGSWITSVVTVHSTLTGYSRHSVLSLTVVHSVAAGTLHYRGSLVSSRHFQ